jgi:hypothetical protein
MKIKKIIIAHFDRFRDIGLFELELIATNPVRYVL